MHVGQLLTLKMRAADPVTGRIITDATGTGYLFAPPKNPQVNVGDRTPDVTISMTYDSVSRYYLATWDSTGAAAGTWWFQGKVVGGASGYNGWDYQSFPLDA